ncbi:SRPBCC family protein [Arthrobacter sp. PsM3]|uniref:SRPBCC family protein n=1 Tax=Arthrobacter sp. PsM3 TaxID=3030531 RepID=UPI00263B9A42|nr:SRPBCC family protein [Arthrobacter sp. PsM3]MDN4645436.1 SRPBCC family protein [Arthrobacter sp. PsM3]
MKSFEAETLIHARNSTVWEIITDGGNFTVWDSGITRLDGELRHGGTIRVRTRTGGNRTFRLRVRQMPGEVMTWTGGLPLGLLKGVRTFTLTPHGGMTHLHVREEFTGPLLGLLRKALPDVERALAEYVRAVRKRAELLGRHEARLHALSGSIPRPAGGCFPGATAFGGNSAAGRTTGSKAAG